MKAHNSTASSSVKSTTTVTAAAIEERDSCYFPGCRKDANCNCEICLASINATLDLMPISIQKSSFTKLSASRRPSVDITPVSFDSSIISTPRSTSSCPKMESPALKSTARAGLNAKKEMRKRKWALGDAFLKLFLGLSMVLSAEIGFSWAVCGVLKPVFTFDTVRGIGEKSWVVEDLSGKLRFLQNGLKDIVVDGKVANCSDMDSIWEINQDGQLLKSRCILYRSVMEEVSIWGWPLQTAGLLKAGFSTRTFTVLSGRVTEWSEGKIGYSIRKANTSWVLKKWESSVVQLDPNTWVMEYGRSSILDNSRLFSSLAELFSYRISRVVKRMNQVSLLFSAFEDQYDDFLNGKDKIPT